MAFSKFGISGQAEMSYQAGRPARRTVSVLFGILALGLLSACSGSSDEEEALYEERPVDVIYNEAMDELEKGDYRDAAEQFDEVERQHPYSVWARRAMLMSSYANYQVNEYDQAILAAQRYISLFPGSQDAAYAYYLIALCYYERIVDVGRDQSMTLRALGALQEVVSRYPESEYARDAQLKIDLTLDHLAGKEMAVGRYYLYEGEYLAAINRFRNVILNYQTTSQVPEALHRLVEAYLTLGIDNEAQTAGAILGYNYPGSRWYEDSYALLADKGLEPQEDEGSWMSRAWDSVF